MIEKYNPHTGEIEFEEEPIVGIQGIPGERGKDGKDGIRGCKWFYGTGEPNEIAEAISGDKYLDNASGDIYEFT